MNVNGFITIESECPFCHDTNEIEVRMGDFFKWQEGELAQNAFPYLSADEREMLISGVCPKCWAKTFGEE